MKMITKRCRRPGARAASAATLTGMACVLIAAGPAAAKHCQRCDDKPGTPAVAQEVYHQIINRTGVCLEIDHAREWDGAAAAVDWCDRQGGDQHWTLKAVDGADGYYQIKVRHSGKCLDVRSASPNDGAQITQWTCHDGQNQQWKLSDAGNGYRKITARHSGKCLDKAGWNVVQWNCHDVHWQRWKLG